MAISNAFLCVFFLSLVVTYASSSTFISDAAFQAAEGFPGRALLQAKKDCTVDFENMNYTVITSKCKGPKYAANLCCDALKEFACPYADQINDMTTTCATTMFSYINIYGKYPPGLFANECTGDKNGLVCPAANETETGKASVKESGGDMQSASYSSLLMLSAGSRGRQPRRRPRASILFRPQIFFYY